MQATPPPGPSATTKPAVTKPRPINGSMSPIRKEQFDFDAARHLLWRAGMGGTAQQIQTLVSWGPEKSVEHLVKFQGVTAPAAPTFSKNIMRPATAEERRTAASAARMRDEDTLAQVRLARQNAEQQDRQQMRDVQQWWLKRMIETPRPLEEKMTLFWHGHFATSYRTIENSYHMVQQNEFFRRNAVGNFADLLFGIIRDPAMLVYLNNNTSRKNKPNENLAREIMELFSLGVGNYTENDIKEGARALTGYTFEDDEFEFQRNNHDNGEKTILGRNGTIDGDGFVNAILEQPACSKFLATKLYRYFVHDYPSGRKKLDEAGAAVIREMSNTLRRTKYQLTPTLRQLFLSQHFYDAAVRNEQIKSPVQLVVGAIRSLNAPARDLATLCDATNMMGQNIFFPQSVKGWDGGRTWINTATMYVRQNTLVFLLTGRRPKGKDGLADQQKFDAGPMLPQLADAFPGMGESSSKTLEALLRFTLGRADPAARESLVGFIDSTGGKLEGETLTQLMLLITAMPEYQLC